MRKELRVFKTEDEEREFWAEHDTADYLDWTKTEEATLPNLRPSLRTISLRLPEPLLADLKLLARRRDVPYQSLMKVFLAERVREELRKPGP